MAQFSRLMLAICVRALLRIALAIAQTRSVRIGDLELDYDASRWRPEPGGADEIGMHPIGAAGDKLDPVHVARFPGSGREDCERLAAAAVGA